MKLPDDFCTLHDYDKIIDCFMIINTSMIENICGVVVSLLHSKNTILHLNQLRRMISSLSKVIICVFEFQMVILYVMQVEQSHYY